MNAKNANARVVAADLRREAQMKNMRPTKCFQIEVLTRKMPGLKTKEKHDRQHD
jgi:hypothetical protein